MRGLTVNKERMGKIVRDGSSSVKKRKQRGKREKKNGCKRVIWVWKDHLIRVYSLVWKNVWELLMIK